MQAYKQYVDSRIQLMRKRWCKHGFFLWVCYRQYYNIKQENKIVKPVTEEGTIKSYLRYFCDTLLVAKLQDVSSIYKFMNSFDKNLQFAIDLFEKEVPYFLDMEMSPDGISIYLNDIFERH